MEKRNSNGGQNTIFLIISYISWVAIAVNNWISLNWLYSEKHKAVWNIYIYLDEEADEHIPIQMYYIMNYIVFNFVFAIILIGCVVFFISTSIKKDPAIMNGMLGQITQFHFFPLLCGFALSVLGELGMDEESYEDFYKPDKAGLAFSLAGLISMIFIYIFTDLKSRNWWANFFLKGSFSCLIVLFWYDFCYDIYMVRLADKKLTEEVNWAKGCAIFFSILFGLSCVIFSFVFKDIMISFLNILIYIGMSIYYFNISEPIRSTKDFNKNGDGVVDIIICVFSIILFFYQIVEKLVNRSNEIKSQILSMNIVQNQIIIKVNKNFENIRLIRNEISPNNNPNK